MPPKKSGATLKTKKKKDSTESDATSHNAPVAVQDDEDYYREPIKRTVKPENQLMLTEEQLDEDFTRVLTANDPNIPNNTTKYNYKEKAYKQDPEGPMDHLVFHFQMDGCSLHKESEDALQQQQLEVEKQMEIERLKKEAAQEAQEAGEENIEAEAPKTGKNQFNYSERAAQTFNNILRSRGVATEPPPVNQFNATVTQWDIYDAYMQDFKNVQQEEEFAKNAEKRKTGGGTNADESGRRSKEDDMVHSQKMSNALKILERMVNQNAEDEIFQDFKYWEDASDFYRNGEGSLLPLWRFSTERTKRKQVTTLCWNPAYPDLFAVAYGSYDFMRQGSGIVCCFSLKNTSHPEYMFSTESGVMCLDFHPHFQSLLAVGCYDGTVMVFDVRNKINRAIYSSSIRTGKHTDPVWQVHWQEEDLAKELNFFSISSDGQVASWIMSKNELKMEPVMQLKLVSNARDDPEEVNLSGLAGGCCFNFNRHNEHLFIVGTEEGKIHKCSKAYSGQYLETYQGHHMAVYALKWNPFHPRVFISCSADWTVKIWDHNLAHPVSSFDLGNAVGDVAWAPYSSTVFAAVTSDGKVHVFDLAENKHEPLCEQKVVKRAKLTHVSFNQRDPILIVGDDRGGVNSLKLSPNLRKVHEPRGEDGEILPHDPVQLQVDKMEKLLQTVSS
ncbi:WD40-repeat-containing domain protein [Ochromonadaceae sp. CCMP2298]|nr:WD40-repeat-containing domain protein [Ochromonadaceae sp. CCMP2298]|mmetsp:Transcript_1007/g.2216  ORF Transcript_1007/g.2216 Transcript_1007/m.2216 type:complete len:669 (+) Transcript_1007:102-2108(+)